MRTANDLNAELLITITETGKSARRMAKYRPRVPVVSVTANYNTAATLQVRV